jgi:hypothetical protein
VVMSVFMRPSSAENTSESHHQRHLRAPLMRHMAQTKT